MNITYTVSTQKVRRGVDGRRGSDTHDEAFYKLCSPYPDRRVGAVSVAAVVLITTTRVFITCTKRLFRLEVTITRHGPEWAVWIPACLYFTHSSFYFCRLLSKRRNVPNHRHQPRITHRYRIYKIYLIPTYSHLLIDRGNQHPSQLYPHRATARDPLTTSR